MKTLITAASLVALLGAAPIASANEGGSCHFHGSKAASEDAVLGCAKQRKEALVKSGKLDQSWQALQHNKLEQVDGKKGKEWKVTFRDPAATNKAKETLYLFFTLPGNFIAANFTGK